MNKTLMMEDLTYEEIDELIRNGFNTALVIASSTEQHGPHLPLSTDEKIGEILGKKIAERTNAIMAPVIRPGCSNHHEDFTGTISISAETLMATIKDYTSSLIKSGFENIVLISTHGGNCSPIMVVASELSKKYEDINIIPISDLEKHLKVWIDVAEEFDVEPNEIKHAGAAETSILLTKEEELVKKDEVRKGYSEKLEKLSIFTNGIKEYSKNGVLGNPNKASKELGEELIDSMVDYFSEIILKEIGEKEA